MVSTSPPVDVSAGGWLWLLDVWADTDFTQGVGTVTQKAIASQNVLLQIGNPAEWTNGNYGLAEGDTAHARVTLLDPTGVGTISEPITAPWRSSSQTTALLQPQRTQGGGLTDAQAQQLTNIEAATSPVSLVDDLTLEQVGTGPTGNPINVALPEAFWGIIVRIASVPDGVAPITPDNDYFSMTLAVVRIYRANDLWMRVPVHTSSKMIPIYNEHIAAAVALVLTSQWILNMHLEVDWAPGVTGSVFMMRFP